MTKISRNSSHLAAARKPSPSPVSILGRAWKSARRDGPVAFAVAVFRRYVIDYRSFFLYEHPLLPPPIVRSLPQRDGFDEFFVEGNGAAERVATARCDFRDFQPMARHALDSGAVAFCIYEGRELAHIGWVATSQTARRALDPLPFEIRFDEGEAWIGTVYTVPRFRNRGLFTYSCVRRFGYLKDAGFSTCKSAVRRSNAASNHVNMRFEPRVYAIGNWFKLFSWRRWSDRPATEDDLPPELRKHHS